MNAPQKLHEMGQSLWLDNISRQLLTSGTLGKYIQDFAVTGLTSNPTIFDHAISDSNDYDSQIQDLVKRGKSGEALFFELALDDLKQAANHFLPIHQRTNAVDGWVSLELSPVMAYDAAASVSAAGALHARAGRPNVFIKIPGTNEGISAIEESIFAGIPINVTLLFSREQYVASANAYLRGIERRIEAGLNPDIPSVASLFISRWDVAVKDKVPEPLRNKLGIAIAQQTYHAYREWLESPRVQRTLNEGARPQRLLWASTGTKDPSAPDTMYIDALAAPFTINTVPEATLKAFADHGNIGQTMSTDAQGCEEMLSRFTQVGVDTKALAAQLQDEGAKAFSKSWNDMLQSVESKGQSLKHAA